MSKRAAYLSIGAAAILWGIIGLFVTQLYSLGFSTAQVVSVRFLSAALFLGLYIGTKGYSQLKIKFIDSRYFIGTGIFSVVIFNWCLFNAIRETSISVATILLYTAPAFVTLLSRLLFKEALTRRKVLALCTTLAGCTLVVDLFPGTSGTVSGYGLLLGLGAGFFYALYSIFGKYALQKYSSMTVSFYTFIFASAAIIPFSEPNALLPLLTKTETWWYITGLGFFSTTLAYLLYTKGLAHIESSRAAIMATIEPVVAAMVGWIAFQEQLNAWQYLGIVLVIMGVLMVQERNGKHKNT